MVPDGAGRDPTAQLGCYCKYVCSQHEYHIQEAARQQRALHFEVTPNRILVEQLPGEQVVQLQNYEADSGVVPIARHVA